MKIVGIGGGTGLPALLRGLRQLRERRADGIGRDRISAAAIVCVSDDGGSSGSLRRSLGIPAVGDLRNCMVALASGNADLLDVFQYRLQGEGLDGHAIGNLIVAALSARSGNLRQAIRSASAFLCLQGEVLPCTEESVTLCAEFCDGEVVRGETSIAARGKRIRRVWLDPLDAAPAAGVVELLHNADAIVLGPGSLHTSIIANLLPAGIVEAIRKSAALKILVCNLMTQPGETENYTAGDHVRAVEQYLGRGVLDVCMVNTAAIPEPAASRYASKGSLPVICDGDSMATLGVVPVGLDLLAADLLAGGAPGVRHDPLKLARWVCALARACRRHRGSEKRRSAALGLSDKHFRPA